MNWNLLPWGGKRLQNIEWDTEESQEEMDSVLVKGKRVKCTPGLRFSDNDGLSVAQRSGWILGWGKLEDLDRSKTHIDWVSKDGCEQKLTFFTNCLLKLEEARLGQKIVLTSEQRKSFAQELCEYLIRPTGAEPTLLTKEGYFLFKKTEEKAVCLPGTVENKKDEFAKLDVLPPIIVTPLAMKELCKNNDLLSLESVHERSSINFNPNIKNTTVADPAEKSIITQEFEDLVGNMSNISLENDIAMGAMVSLMDQTALSDADLNDLSVLQRDWSSIQNRYQQNLQQIHLHKAKLNDIRSGMELAFIEKKATFDALNETVAARSRELAQSTAEHERINREMSILTDAKNEQIAELEVELASAQDEIADLKRENQSKVAAEALFESEDTVADIQQKLDAKKRREQSLQIRIENLKIENADRLGELKHENRSLLIKKVRSEKTLRDEKQVAASVKQEMDEIRRERDALQAQKDDLEWSLQNMNKEARRLSSTKTELDVLHSRAPTCHEPQTTFLTLLEKERIITTL